MIKKLTPGCFRDADRRVKRTRTSMKGKPSSGMRRTRGGKSKRGREIDSNVRKTERQMKLNTMW